jgi:long-chain acyl-CoA synthetase
MMIKAVERNPNHVAFKYKENGKIISETVQCLYESCNALGAALTKRGYKKTHIACIGENSYKWIQSYLTVLMSDSVFVPLDRELPVKDIIFLINESDSTVVFLDKKREKMLSEHQDKMPKIDAYICFDREEDEGKFLSFNKLISEGSNLDSREYEQMTNDPNALKDLVYTSGTTGVAKGVMLSEHNLVSSVYYGLGVSSVSNTGLSVLPYNHTYEAVCDILVSIHAGTTLAINDSLKNVQNNMRLYKPNYVYLVPAFAEHFYNAIQKNIDKQGKRGFFKFATALSNALCKIGIDVRRKLFKSIHKEFGGNLRRIVCGGAKIRPEIGKFFGNIGIIMTGGYGITECSPLVSVNDEKDNNYASAGHRLACLDWKIEDKNDEGIGEICVKGDVVMLGYYKRPDLTSEVLVDGWFKTGDYGYINERDEIVITGRKKNIIVLNNGKNIYPEEIEGYIQALPYVVEVVVSGIKNEHGQDVGLRATVYTGEDLIEKSRLEADTKTAMRALPSYKQISDFQISTEPFPKTTTNKIKRVA